MNVRLSLVLVAVLALIGGFVYFTQARPSPGPKDERPLFYQVDMTDIVRIEVEHEGTRVGFLRAEEGWTFDDAERTPVNMDKFSGTTLLLSGPRAERLLAEEIDDPARYGLDPPRTAINVGLKDGQEFEIHLGDKTPDGSKQYASLVGSPSLFLIVSVWGDVLAKLVTEPPYPAPEGTATPGAT